MGAGDGVGEGAGEGVGEGAGERRGGRRGRRGRLGTAARFDCSGRWKGRNVPLCHPTICPFIICGPLCCIYCIVMGKM